MVVLPSGSFRMGSPSSEPDRDDDEGPQRTVRIGYKLAVGKYEVTWSQWPKRHVSAHGACDGCRTRKASGSEIGWGKGSRPVNSSVSCWNDAQAYVKWLSRKTGHTYRLLSEAEWEYAARAGTTSAYSFGTAVQSPLWGKARSTNHKRRCSGRRPPVGTVIQPMHGAFTTCTGTSGSGWRTGTKSGYSHAPSDGSAFTNCSSCSLRVHRGGSWQRLSGASPLCHRRQGTPTFRDYGVGFRVARVLED